MEFIKITSQALQISFQNKVLWWFNLIPTLFLLITGAIFIYAFYSPVVELYLLFGRAGSESLTVLNLLQDKAIDGISFIVPLLMVFLALAIISKNALIKSIQLVINNKPVDVKSGFAAGRGYFGTTCILITMIVGMSLVAHGVEYYLQGLTSSRHILVIIDLILEVAIIFCALFSLHFVLIRHDPVLSALQHSFKVTTKNFGSMLIFFFVLLGVALLVVSLLGAAVGVGYYVSFVTGSLIGLLVMVALIPVNVFLTTLWTLFFLALSKPHQSK